MKQLRRTNWPTKTQIRSARVEDLRRLSEQLEKKMETRLPRAPLRPDPGPQSPPEGPALRVALVGLPMAGRASFGRWPWFGIVVILRRAGPSLVVARWAAAARFNSIMPPGKNAPLPAPARPICRSSRRGRRQHTESKRPWIRRHASSPRRQLPQRLRSKHSCCKTIGPRRSRECGREISKAQGAPSNKIAATIQKP